MVLQSKRIGRFFMIGVYDYTVIATYLSLLLGLGGLYSAAQNEPLDAMLCLMLAGLLDAFDGRIARTKKDRTEQEKRFGIQIDSLNDLVCFGVLPAAIGWSMDCDRLWFLATMSFFALCALIRLAYFNVTEEERQNQMSEHRAYYLGVPVTAEPVEEPPEDLTVMDEATGVEDTVPAMESETDAQPVAPRLVVAPLVGEEVAAFSVDELKYNETLGDWRTHDGIDIAAEVGTQVIAGCSGVVTAVRDDDMMGTLVTIAHDDGYETTYANLRSSPGVGEGQYVSAGEVIGAVGSSSIAEFSMPAHLHFSVSKDGVPCDPAEFLN